MTILVLSRRHPFAGTSRSRRRTRFTPSPANAVRASPTSPRSGRRARQQRSIRGQNRLCALGDPNLRYGVLDPACFKEDGGPSIAERINKVLIQARLRPFHAADNSRVPQRGSMGGWDQLRARLVGQDGLPMIYFFSTCAASIRTIPALQHDRARMEDVDTESEDHCADDARYAAMSRPFARNFVWEPNPRQ